MKYMKIEDLESGDIIKFDPMRIQEWDPRFRNQARLYTSVFKKIIGCEDGFYYLIVDFINGSKFIENWSVCVDTKLEILFDILHLV